MSEQPPHTPPAWRRALRRVRALATQPAQVNQVISAAAQQAQQQRPAPQKEPAALVSLAHPIHTGFMLAVGIGLALGLYFAASYTSQLLVWILAAFFIALGLDPVVRLLERKGVPRPVGILATVATLIAAVSAFFSTFIPAIVQQTSDLVTQTPKWVEEFVNSELFVQIDSQFEVRSRVMEEVNKFFSNSDAMTGALDSVFNVGGVVVTSFAGTVTILILSLYFLASLPGMKRWGYRLAPQSRRARVEELSEEIIQSVGNYVIGQACIAILNGLFAFILMMILGLPFSTLLGFLVALLAFIPLVGGMTALVVVTLVSLTAGLQSAIIFAIFYICYLQVEAYIISPRVMKRAVAVPAALAVVSVIAGGTLLGVLGALIAIPTAAAALTIIKRVFIVRQDQR